MIHPGLPDISTSQWKDLAGVEASQFFLRQCHFKQVTRDDVVKRQVGLVMVEQGAKAMIQTFPCLRPVTC